MKKIIAIILCLIMIILACSCNSLSDENDGSQEAGTSDLQTEEKEDSDMQTTDTQKSETVTTDTESSDISDENDVTDTPATQSTYFSREVATELERYFKEDFYHFSAYGAGGAPYAMQDIFTISNARVKSITIPVYKVTNADANGDYSFSLYVFNNSLEGLKRAPLRQYSLKLNKDDYGFVDGLIVNRFVKVDLAKYNIVLSASETLAWFSAADTVIPAYISVAASPAKAYLSENAPNATGFLQRLGTADMGPSSATLLMDFEFERDDLNKNDVEYRELIDQLKDKYRGKYVSVIGDSISTFQMYSNNTSYNSTIGSNEVYYSSNNIASWRCTYWGKLINDLDMKLCVNNSRSGKTVYGVPALNYADSSIFRATELDNDNCTPGDPTDDIAPDVILFYQGINDITLNSPFGDLYNLLKNADATSYNKIVDDWFKAVLAKTDNGNDIDHGATITSFEQAYALTVYKMKTAYPDAEIYCLDLIENLSKSAEVIDKYNLCIHAIVDYFDGVTLVEHRAQSGINPNNYHSYMADAACLHPAPSGFWRMSTVIMKAMLKNAK